MKVSHQHDGVKSWTALFAIAIHKVYVSVAIKLLL